MANHPSSKEDTKLGSNAADSMQKFKLTTEMKKCLISHMHLKPCGINKHLSMLLLREILSEEFKVMVPTKCIWNYLYTEYNIEAADKIEGTLFNTDDKNFDVPEEYDQLVVDEGEKIKKVQEKGRLNDEINKRKLSVDSNDGLNETVPETIFQNSFVEKNYNKSEEASNTRRSLRYNDKPGEKEQNFLLNNKPPNESKYLEMFQNMYINKQIKNYIDELTGSDGSSKTVTPVIVNVEISNICVTPETICGKSNLRSNDKDIKSFFELEKEFIKDGHFLTSPNLKDLEDLENLEYEKQFASLIEPKSEHSMQNNNKETQDVKEKTRRRVTSDQLVVLESPEQPLDRRSCNKKSA